MWITLLISWFSKNAIHFAIICSRMCKMPFTSLNSITELSQSRPLIFGGYPSCKFFAKHILSHCLLQLILSMSTLYAKPLLNMTNRMHSWPTPDAMSLAIPPLPFQLCVERVVIHTAAQHNNWWQVITACLLVSLVQDIWYTLQLFCRNLATWDLQSLWKMTGDWKSLIFILE